MRFFVLKYKPGFSQGQTEFSAEEPVSLGPAPQCEACGAFLGMLGWLPPFRVVLETWGSVFGDVAYGAGCEILVSQRFRTLWLERGLTGLDGFDNVEVVRIKRHDRSMAPYGSPPSYYRVRVVRGNAAVDERRSELERDDVGVCPVCRSGKGGGVTRAKRIVLEKSTWSGEDLFIARGLPGTYLTTGRFKCFCDDCKITNALLLPAEEYSFDFYPHNREKG